MKKFSKVIISILIIGIAVFAYRNTSIMENIKYLSNKYTNDLKEIIAKGSLITNKELASIKDSGVDYSEYKVNTTTSPYYNMLNKNEKELYRQIYANADNYKETFMPKVSVTKNELKNAIGAVFNDSPELFWLDTSYSYKYKINGDVAQVKLNYNSTINNIETSKELFNSKVEKIISNANLYGTNYEKEKYVHDYLIKFADYDVSEDLNQSSYSALVLGKTVCAGYSKAFQLIMNRLGIITYYVTGTSEGEAHAWNIVKLSDGYYNIDLTWDDQNTISYKYFNKTDSEFQNTHERGTTSMKLPTCNGTLYAYKKTFINNSTNRYDEEYIKNHIEKRKDKVSQMPEINQGEENNNYNITINDESDESDESDKKTDITNNTNAIEKEEVYP